MLIIWLFILYFIVKSSYWKKFFLYLSFVFLLASSMPITSTYIGKLFYSDNYKISNNNKKPAYILIPTAGMYYDGYEKWHPTAETVMRIQYGKQLSEQFSVPLIVSGGRHTHLLSKNFDYNFYLLDNESGNTFEMAKNLKKFINISDGPLLLATTPVHHKRTILTLKKHNFDVLIPDNYVRVLSGISYSVIPSIEGFARFNAIIYEFLGIAWYYITGKI